MTAVVTIRRLEPTDEPALAAIVGRARDAGELLGSSSPRPVLTPG